MQADGDQRRVCHRKYKNCMHRHRRDGQMSRRNRSAGLRQSVRMMTLGLAARMRSRHRSLTALLRHVMATLALGGRKADTGQYACDCRGRYPHQHDAEQKGCSTSGHSDHYSFS